MGARLRDELGAHPMAGDIRGAGLFWGIEAVADRATRRPFPPSMQVARKLVRAATDLGVAIYPAAGMAAEQGGDAVMIAPPFVIGDAEVELIAGALRQSFDSVHRSLPAG